MATPPQEFWLSLGNKSGKSWYWEELKKALEEGKLTLPYTSNLFDELRMRTSGTVSGKWSSSSEREHVSSKGYERGRKPFITEQKYWHYATSTEVTDLNRAQEALTKLLLIKADRPLVHPVQFVYCGSPQTALCITKLISEMHETTLPLRPRKVEGRQGNVYRAAVKSTRTIDFENAANFLGFPNIPNILHPHGRETLFASLFRNLQSQRVQFIKQHLHASLKFNIKLDMYEDGKDSNLIDVALQNISPKLDRIHIAQEGMGRPLQLQQLMWGQHTPLEDIQHDPLLVEIFKSCGWVWVYKHHIFISARPTICSLNDEGALHSTRGAALEYPDGFQVHCIDGVRVPKHVVENPEMIKKWQIDKEANIEVRRIMMDRYKLNEEVHGIGAYVRDSHAIRLDHDEHFGTLWRLPNAEIIASRWVTEEVEDIAMLEVVNSTPEPDGHFKHYWLRVPPNIRSSREASAWSFGMTANDYAPEVET